MFHVTVENYSERALLSGNSIFIFHLQLASIRHNFVLNIFGLKLRLKVNEFDVNLNRNSYPSLFLEQVGTEKNSLTYILAALT